MSGDTVTGRALQFTNDNKYAYAYSGTIGVTNVKKTMLKFNTNSEYLIAEFNMSCNSGAGDDFDFIIKIDGINVLESQITTPAQPSARFINPIKLILPSYSEIEVTLENVTQASTLNWTVTLAAKVGMPQRVGNLDD